MPSRFLKAFTLGCVSRADARERTQKVRFGVPLTKAFRGGVIPPLLVDLLVHISRNGVTTNHIFRQPGNNSDVKAIVRQLSKGKRTNFHDYSYLTLASVVKKFLLDIPGGIFGMDIEEKLLSILKFTNHFERFNFVNKIIVNLPKAVQQFVVLLFGIWFRIVNHNEFNSITPEGMARSVAGCIFRNSVDDPAVVMNATKVMELLIDEFAMPSMFGSDNLQYFADTTCSGILVHENFTFEYRDPHSSSRDFASSTTGDTGPVHGVAIIDGDRGDGISSGMKPVTAPPQQWAPRSAALIPSQVTERGQLPALCSSAPDINLPPQPGFSSMTHLSGGESGGGSNSSNQERSQRAASSSTPPARSHQNHEYCSMSLSRLDPVFSRQIARMQVRSQWFLAGVADPAADALTCPSACDSVASDGAQSLAALPAAADDTARQDEAAGRGTDSATVQSSDDARSMFSDFDDVAGCSLGLRLGARSSVDSTLPVASHCDTIRFCDGVLVHHYYRQSSYQPQAAV